MTVKTAKKAAAVKTPEPIENRFRGKCVDCGNWVGAANGVATPPSKKGEKWTVHHGHIADNGSAVIGPCPKPATVKSRANNNQKENAMPVRRTRKPAPAPKKIETFSAEHIAALTLVELRTLARELSLDEQMKKIGILNELIAKGHLIDESEDTTPAPAKKTTARKRVAPTREADEDESASGDDDQDELGAALAGMLDTIKTQIASGALDVILGGIEDAISDRLDAVAAETQPVKRAAKKTTTPARSKSEKLAPVKRAPAKVEDESTEDGELEVGKIYTVGGKSKLTGARGKFISYKDDEKTRVIIALTKAHGDYVRGHKVSLPAKSINV